MSMWGRGKGEWRELKARNSLVIPRAFESRTLESWGYFSDGYNGSGQGTEPWVD